MRKMVFVFSMLIIGSFALTACEPAANTATANKPTNAVNNANTATAPVSAAAIEADLKKLVNDTAAALAKNDADALDKMYGDNYMLVNLDGSVQTKAERLASFRSGDTKFETFAYDEVNVRTNAEGTGAVVISRATAKGTNKGKATDGTIRVTQVWSKMKDGWKQVSGHATQITGASASTPAANTATANKPANTAANNNK
ncbi:MAG: nuclear transport factor 2 family protein [Saprospiraceae bacterium]|nr:nuclear transport factor 2 family protein [Pyrinomonadaceae bacterium]